MCGQVGRRRDDVSCLLSEQQQWFGRRNQASVADGMTRLWKPLLRNPMLCASPPNTHTLKIGCRSQNPGSGLSIIAIPQWGHASCLQGLFRSFTATWGKLRRTASRPRTFLPVRVGDITGLPGPGRFWRRSRL